MLHHEPIRFRVVSAHRHHFGDTALAASLAMWTTRSIANAIASRTLRAASPAVPDTTQCASRVSACSAELLWIVVILPRCPVFSACSKSNASAPTHFADDDPIGTVTQRGTQQVRDRHRRQCGGAAKRRRALPRFEPHIVWLLEQNL